MSITDVISHLRLDVYPRIAMVIFLIVFVAVVIRIFSPRMREASDAWSRLPLQDDGCELNATPSARQREHAGD